MEPTVRQEQLERDMTDLGVRRYERDRTLPWKEGTPIPGVVPKDEADLPPGQAVVTRNIELVAGVIRAGLERTYEGKAGRYARRVPDLIGSVDPIVLATITLRQAISAAGRQAAFTSTLVTIGGLVEEHIAIEALFAAEKKLANWWERKAEQTGNAQHARATMRRGASDQLDQSDWRDEQKLMVGAWLLEIVEDNLGIITRRTERRGKRTTELVVPTEEFAAWLNEMHAKCALLRPLRLPMVTPPIPWTTPDDGGYLTLSLKVMKNASRQQLDDLAATEMPQVYDALNALQETRWAINGKVLNVLRDLRDAPAGAPCIPAAGDEPIPMRPQHIPEDLPISSMGDEDKAAITTWRKAAAEAYSRNAIRMSKRVAFAQKVWVAEHFAAEPVIYYPMQIDTRGRIYTVPTEVGPQSDDLGKALVQFADRKPLGEGGAYWLAVHVANCYGVDKVTFDERVQWVADNEELILEVAIQGSDRPELWADADSPWQFLAACCEWAGYILSGRSDDFESALPIGMDGTCSGLQHFSAALRDAEGGQQVNLLPTGKVEDLYSAVAARVNLRLNGSTCADNLLVWRGKVDRKIVKQPCMTYAYSATVAGMRGQILNALKGKADGDKPEGDDYLNALALAPLVRECIEDTVVAAAGAMRWLQQIAGLLTDLGLDIRWMSAAGLPVTQSERKVRERQVSVWYMGKRFMPQLASHTEVLDKLRQRSAVAPNWVHSQDASHLMMVVNDMWELGVTDFAMIHDSFGVHACHVERLHQSIREKFVELYSVDRLRQVREHVLDVVPEGTDVPELPAYGSLNLSEVLESEYFFA